MRRKSWGGLAVGILAAGVLSFVFSPKKNGKICQNVTDRGEVRISLKAIEEMSVCIVQRLSGVVSVRPIVNEGQDGLKIRLYILVKRVSEIESDTSLTDTVRYEIERLAGLPVSEVIVSLRTMGKY